MNKVTLFLIPMLFLFLGLTMASENWQFEKILIDYEQPADNGTGVHGVAVAPDGNIWLALHGDLAKDSIATENDTIYYRPVHILDPDGNHVSFSPLRVLEFPDGTLDTLHAGSPHNGSGKGISVDQDGNILFTSWSTVYRIDYTDGKALDRFTPEDMSSMTEAVQDENGNIYVGYVLGGARPVYLLNDDFEVIGNAIDTLGHITRTLAVTPDGKDLYIGSTWNGFGIEHWHSDIPGVLEFAAVDTFGNWDEVYVEEEDSTYTDVKLWSSCLDWGPDGHLWAGNLRPDWAGPKGAMWYSYDVETHERMDSVGVPMGEPSEGGFYSPRGAAWSNDGNTMYLADFDYNMVSVWKKAGSAIEQDGEVIARTFKLQQNYPNPFNPVTTIPFELYKRSNVELKVYDVNGREVETLISSQMNTGKHEYTYDASDLASGVYYYQLTIEGQTLSKRMILVK